MDDTTSFAPCGEPRVSSSAVIAEIEKQAQRQGMRKLQEVHESLKGLPRVAGTSTFKPQATFVKNMPTIPAAGPNCNSTWVCCSCRANSQARISEAPIGSNRPVSKEPLERACGERLERLEHKCPPIFLRPTRMAIPQSVLSCSMRFSRTVSRVFAAHEIRQT
jgi:hypothetical protein